MEGEVLSAGFPYGMVLIGAAVGLAIWVVRTMAERFLKEFDRRLVRLESELEMRMQSSNERVARIEEQLRTAPTHADLALLHEKINSVQNSNSRIEGSLEHVSSNLRLLLLSKTGAGHDTSER